MAKKQKEELPEIQGPEAPVPVDPQPLPKRGKGQYFTYVGGGEDSPRVIDFMGKQRFVRGKAVEVTDPTLLAKIVGNPAFTEGDVDEEELHEYDQGAKTEADKQRAKDKRTQTIAAKASAKHDWADKGE